MPIDKRSRYAASPTVEWTRPDGSIVKLVAPTLRPARVAVFSRVVTDTDRLDTLAARYYRDPRKLYRLADAAGALDPFDALVPGAPVAIPPDR
jgi:nucleoid-associated protein YgaU